jgi:precorrin-6x reductase
VITPKERRRSTTDAVASAIALHLKNAAVLMAAQTASAAGGSTNEAEIIARLDLILARLERPRVVQKEPAIEFPLSWVKLEKYVELSGDSVDAVMGRRKLGKWLDGQQCKIVDGRVWIDLRAAQRWVEEWDRISPTLASDPFSRKPKR